MSKPDPNTEVVSINIPPCQSYVSPAVDLIDLSCLVLGDNPSHIFQVQIASTATVSIKAIKEEKENTFRNVDADSPQVQQVVKLSVEDAVRPQLQDEDQISRLPMLKLSTIFSDLNEERLHVVIQPPPLASSVPAHLKLNCFVLGGGPNRVFEIKIAPTESVSALKELIEEEKKQTFRNVDADTLQLWKVNIKLKKGVLKNIKTETDIEDQDREELEDM